MKTVKSEDYQTLKNELDTLIENLQHNETDVDAALKGYERGLAIIKQLQLYLEASENKIKQLKLNQG